MSPAGPSFWPFPFDRVRKLRRRDAALESLLARWVAARPLGDRLAALAGGPVRARLDGVVDERGQSGRRGGAPDPYAALAEVRCGGVAFAIAASARPVRALAQRLLGGPLELDAPRPLTIGEHAIWALAVAAAIADLGIAAEVWPLERGGGVADAITVAFTVELPPALASPGSVMTVTASVAPDVVVRAPPPRPPHAWRFDVPIVVGRCALPAASLARLTARDVIVAERCLELAFASGGIGLAAAPGALEARVVTEYVARDMALPDQASLELTVHAGAARLSLRQLGELAIGQIVPLGRPLAGPYEIRAAGRVVGQGELVDIDGELGVRIVSIAEPDQE